ncbi:nitroreductase family protein [Maribellus sediminis]|uniref:nitroreductase family protein n=1 Tax=Maribellus sediminis TaxID=2696285 RepID=UPI0014315321|nr:nitroreductase [Maribellus sediminis]
MSISEIIKNRRATPPRFLTGKGIARETIETLLENASWAPNHKKTEPWRFQVFAGDAKQELAQKCETILHEKQAEGYEIASEKIEKFAANLKGVPVAIVTILQVDPAHRLPEWEELAAVSMAVQNMWLTATEMGLGAFWATPGFMNLFDDILGLQEGQKALGFFYVGEILMDYPSPGRGDQTQKVEWK